MKFAKIKIYLLLLGCAVIYKKAGAQADTASGNWGLIRMNDNSAYVLSNSYRVHDSTYMKVFMDRNNINDWGGSVEFTGIPAEGVWWGAGVGQIIVGVWPWPGTGNTTNSGMPFRICSGRNYVSNWEFEFVDTNTLHSWAFYYEIWVHKSKEISGDNISADIMIQPDYDEHKGTYQGSLVDNHGKKWSCYVNFTSRYEIIHFNREEKTRKVENLDLKPFWDFCVENGWAKSTDNISCITAGLEAFSSGSAMFKTTKWSLVSNELNEDCSGVGIRIASASPNPVYPNPAREFIYMDLEEQSYYNIYDQTGKLVQSGLLQMGNRPINISNVEPGLYYIETKGISSSECWKIVIQ